MKQRIKTLFAGGVLALALFSSAMAGPLDDGEAAYKRGDYKAAMRFLRPLALQGGADAQFKVGVMYDQGWGVPQNYTQALAWFREAAQQGVVGAQFNLGVMYAAGRGVARDETEAALWYHEAAEQGNAAAQNNLGAMYQTGHGVPQDDAQAAFWYRKAADQGNAGARNNLSSMYRNDQGVPGEAPAAPAEQQGPKQTWWVLARSSSFLLDTCETTGTTSGIKSPGDFYETAKTAGSAKIVDKDDEVDVIYAYHGDLMQTRYFRTQETCQKAAQANIDAADAEKTKVDKYR